MNTLRPLFLREWLQHRFGWALLAGIPIALALLIAGFARIHVDADGIERAGDALPALMALGSIGGSTLLLFVIALVTSAILVTGLARRDHADRSIEFWLSLPVGHAASLGAPLLVHLLLVPAAALLVGLAGGLVLSLLVVGRAAGVQTWLSLPWTDLLAATGAAVARLLAGLPLAMLWLLPVVLLVVLFTAWFRRWGLVILAIAIGLGSQVLERLFGQPMLSQAIAGLVREAAGALAGAGDAPLRFHGAEQFGATLQMIPMLAFADFGNALARLASPGFVGAMVFSAACFALLVDWRRRGAQAGS